MCVIVANSKGKIPSIAELRMMEESNPDGIGIAWRANNGVHYHKGLKFEQMWKMATKIVQAEKLPYIIHFRISTVGGDGDKFCHPWPITDNRKELFNLHGITRSVLAHNGTWMEWDQAIKSDRFLEFVRHAKWSDSAVMAYLLGRRKDVGLSKYTQRIVTLSQEKGLTFFGDFDEQDGIKYSNLFWQWSMENWHKWTTNEGNAQSLAAAPDYKNLPTICDLESMRRKGQISKRKFRRLKKLIRQAGMVDKCDIEVAKTMDDAFNRAIASGSEDYHTLYPHREVSCEECGCIFSSSYNACPQCHTEIHRFYHVDGVQGIFASQYSNQDMSFGCIDGRCGDCNWSKCKHFCHIWKD